MKDYDYEKECRDYTPTLIKQLKQIVEHGKSDGAAVKAAELILKLSGIERVKIEQAEDIQFISIGNDNDGKVIRLDREREKAAKVSASGS